MSTEATGNPTILCHAIWRKTRHHLVNFIGYVLGERHKTICEIQHLARENSSEVSKLDVGLLSGTNPFLHRFDSDYRFTSALFEPFASFCFGIRHKNVRHHRPSNSSIASSELILSKTSCIRQSSTLNSSIEAIKQDISSSTVAQQLKKQRPQHD
jgi:hypothetical protein